MSALNGVAVYPTSAGISKNIEGVIVIV